MELCGLHAPSKNAFQEVKQVIGDVVVEAAQEDMDESCRKRKANGDWHGKVKTDARFESSRFSINGAITTQDGRV